MKKFAIAAALAFLLAGCATTGTGTGTPPSSDSVINAIRTYTQTACGFLPVVQDVIPLLAIFYPSGVPGVQAATVIGAAICAGVSPPQQVAAGGIVTKRVATPKGTVTVRGQSAR